MSGEVLQNAAGEMTVEALPAELERASGGEAFRALPLYEQFLFAQREPERARRYLAE